MYVHTFREFVAQKCITTQYIGEIEGIPTSADMSNRNYLLANLDDARNSGQLPWRLGMENNVTVTLSAYNVKIIKDDRGGVSPPTRREQLLAHKVNLNFVYFRVFCIVSPFTR